MRRFAMCCALAVTQVAVAAPVEVELRAQSEVAGDSFRLGDVAEVRGGEGALAAELRAMRIGRSPRAGGVLALERAALERWLAAARPGLGATLRVLGADRALVQRGPLQRIEWRAVRREAQRALRSSLAAHYEELELAPARAGDRAWPVPEGALRLEARVPALPVRGGRSTVWVDLIVDGRAYQSVPVTFGVRGLRDVLVTRRDLEPGALLRPGDVAARRADAAALEDFPVPADAELGALRAVRPLRAGTALTLANVARARAVRRDEEIRVRAAVGAIAVETTAVATRDATAGEVIRVRNAGSGQMFSVRVTAPGLAQAPEGAR